MPNHIKNRIEIIGTSEQVSSIVNRFSTFYPREIRRAVDNTIVYHNKQDNEWGYLDEKTNKFSKRNKGGIYENYDCGEIPEGFEVDYTEAWTRFPDFNKIIEMPQSLNIQCTSDLSPLENQFSYKTYFKDHLDTIRKRCSENPDKKEENINNFIAGIKNYIEYGYATWYEWSINNWGTKWNCYECKKISDTVYEFDTAWAGVPMLIELISKEFPEVKFKYEFSDEDTGANCGIAEYLNGEILFKKLENYSKEAYELAFKLKPEDKKYFKLVNDKYEYNEE